MPFRPQVLSCMLKSLQTNSLLQIFFDCFWTFFRSALYPNYCTFMNKVVYSILADDEDPLDNEYYSFLNVSRTATQEEITAAYKKLSRLELTVFFTYRWIRNTKQYTKLQVMSLHFQAMPKFNFCLCHGSVQHRKTIVTL